MKILSTLFSMRCMVVIVAMLVSAQIYLQLSEMLYIKPSNDGQDDVNANKQPVSSLENIRVNVTQRQMQIQQIKFKHCDVSNDWTLFRNLPNMTTDLNSWTYEKVIKCPTLFINNVTHQKSFIRIQCNTSKVRYSNKIQTIEHGERCLDNFIEQCCTDNKPVPNIVHYIWYGLTSKFSFYGFLSFISVLRFVRPCVILLHGDSLPNGHYWKLISYIYPNIIHVNRLIKPDIFFGKMPKMKNHFSDVIRLEALLKYGGIYFDMDMVLVKEIDFLRKYPCTMSRLRPTVIGSSFIMAKRNSQFLQKWLEGYKYHYRNDSYIYNAMQYPSLLAYNYSNLIHVEYETLSRPWALHAEKLYENIAYNWSHLLGIHFYSRINKEYVDENKIKLLNTTFGAIARHILYGNKEICTD